MKYCQILFLAVFILFSGIVSAQPGIQWSHNYGGDDDMDCRAVISTHGGGFALGGSTGRNNADFLIIVTDGQGEEIWRNNYDLGGNDHCSEILQTADGGFVLAGTIWSGNSSRYAIMGINQAGEEIWSHNFGRAAINEVQALARTHDNGFLIAGMTSNADYGAADFYAVKVDSDGEFVWQRAYTYEFDQYLMGIAPTAFGGFILAGYSISAVDEFNRSNDVFLVKIAQNGVPLFEWTHETDTWDLCTGIVNSNDGGFALAGFSAIDNGADLFLSRLDANGDLLWRRDYSSEGYQYCHDVTRTPEGGYALAGSYHTGNQNEDFHLFRVDESGDEEWELIYGDAGQDMCFQITPAENGGYAMAGFTTSYGQGESRAYLVLTEMDPVSVPAGDINHPTAITLDAAYPNPFNSTTKISFTIPARSRVNLEICNPRGQLVDVLSNRMFPAGNHSLVWDGSGFAAGVYMVRITGDDGMVGGQSREIVLLK